MTLRHRALIRKLTLSQKATLLSGANFWNTVALPQAGVPSIMMTDGPHGLRKQAGKEDHLGINKSVPATCFPTAAALAQSWDEALLERVGLIIGAEAVANNVGAVLGPGLNIVRDPLAGRAFEYFSEDPYVSGKLAAAMIRGIQANGIAATPKHFAVNSQEHMRMSVDEIVDERTLHELYLEGFRRAITEGKPKLLMTAYNKINGIYANEHEYLLRTVLRDTWRYDGAIVTDWGGNHDPVAAIRARAGLEMPSSHGLTATALENAVKSGKITENELDMAVDSLLELVFTTHAALHGEAVVDIDAHHEAAVDAARRSMVLLKNDENTLPLAYGTRVAVVGDFAEVPRYQGAGSSLVNPTKLSTALNAIRCDDALQLVGYEPGFIRTGGASKRRLARAVRLAQQADAVVVYVGLDESKEAEGIDRTTLALPDNQLECIAALAAVHSRVIVVVAAGGAVELPFADNVQAIIAASLAGQGGGVALADILAGRVSPSGKLTVSYPLHYSDAPTAGAFPGRERTAEHREGLYVGYRYYETADVAVLYPFGHGLSYTTFSYTSLRVRPHEVTFTIKNTGNVAGEEVVQLYVCPPQGKVFRPARELKGFVKVALQPGQSKRITVPFDDHTFAHYDVASGKWKVAGGEYTVEIGASVRDIRLSNTVAIQGAARLTSYDPAVYPHYYSGDVAKVSKREYEALLGRSLPAATWNRKAKLTPDDTIAQLQYGTLRGRVFLAFLHGVKRLLFAIGKPHQANNVTFVINLPFARIPGFTGGKLSLRTVRWLFGLRK